MGALDNESYQNASTNVIGTADNSNYKLHVMEPGIIIKIERERRDWSQLDLAKRVGISQVAIKKIESGETHKSRHLAKIAEVLEIDLARLDSSLSQHGENTGHPKVTTPLGTSELNKLAIGELVGENDLPVFATARGGRGVLVLSNEPFTHISRPRRLVGRKSCYGVLIVDDSMAKEYNHGDIAYVDPNIPPRKGDPCVFQGTRQDGTVEAMIKYLDRSPDASDRLYFVSQTNPPRKFSIKKADWQKCEVLVGKESGR